MTENMGKNERGPRRRLKREGAETHSGQRAKWVGLMMLLRLRERFRCWASFRVVLTRKGIDAMYKAYKKRRKKRRGASDDEADASADEGRADPGTAESDQTASAAEGTLGRGTRRAATSTDYGGPVARRRRAEDGEAEQTRRVRRGREQDFAEISRRGCTKRLGAAGTRGTMWKTASASPPSGGRPRLVADHTHKEPCTKIARAGACSFLPISQ